MSTSLQERTSSYGVFDRPDELGEARHEQVVFCRDEATGLRAIISIHSTRLGPALGGTRFHPYADEASALTDGLRLAEGMTYKAAAAGMPLGGGKAVIIGDPRTAKTPELLRAYGRFVDSLGGRYVTAADVGTTSADLDVIGKTTTHVVGRSAEAGGSGDSGWSTAYGVFVAMQAAARTLWGSEPLADRTVGVEGVGKVGRHLVELLRDAGARVVVSDADPATRERVRQSFADVEVMPSVREAAVDVYAPCALGATLDHASVPQLRAALVCGAANNQLLESSVADRLRGREIVWVPDYVANAGGLIQVGGELGDRTPSEVRQGVEQIAHTVEEILHLAAASGTTTAAAARTVVDRRLHAATPDGT